MLNKDSHYPLYRQLSEKIRKQILNGDLKKGEKIDTIKDLEKIYKVSSVTVRKAINILEAEGFLVSIQGKGTFVSEDLVDEFPSLKSLSEVMVEKGLKPEVKVVEYKRIIAPHHINRIFSNKKKDFLFVKRLHLFEEIHLALSYIYLPWLLGAKFTAEDIEQYSIYALLEKKIGLAVKTGTQIVRAEMADAEAARLLKIKEGLPLLVAERTTRDKNKLPVEYIILKYRADYYKLRIQLQREDLK